MPPLERPRSERHPPFRAAQGALAQLGEFRSAQQATRRPPQQHRFATALEALPSIGGDHQRGSPCFPGQGWRSESARFARGHFKQQYGLVEAPPADGCARRNGAPLPLPPQASSLIQAARWWDTALEAAVMAGINAPAGAQAPANRPAPASRKPRWTAASNAFGQTLTTASPPLARAAPSSRAHRKSAIAGGAGAFPPRAMAQALAAASAKEALPVTNPSRRPRGGRVQLGPGPGRGGSPGQKPRRRGEGHGKICRAPWIRPSGADLRLDLCHPGSAPALELEQLLSGGPPGLLQASRGGFELAKASPAQPRAATPKATTRAPLAGQGPSSWGHSGHKDRPQASALP